MECSSLESIEIPSSVLSLGYYCFNNCHSLTSIVIPSSVTSLGEECFSWCINLNTIELPSSLVSLGESCFGWCSSIDKITCYAVEPPSAYSSTFDNESDCTLYVPSQSLDKYKEDTAWSVIEKIHPLEDTGISNINMNDVSILSENGNICITGLGTNKTVSFYSLDGKPLGTSTVTNGTAECKISKSNGIVIAKIGDASIKVTL